MITMSAPRAAVWMDCVPRPAWTTLWPALVMDAVSADPTLPDPMMVMFMPVTPGWCVTG